MLLINLGFAGGGAERCSRELFTLLPTRGVQTHMWIGRRQENLPDGVEIMPASWEQHFNWLEALPCLTDWRHRGSIDMLDKLAPRDFDLVHLHNLHSGCLSIKAVWRLCQRLPVVWTHHDEWGATGGCTSLLEGLIAPSEIKKNTRGLMRYIPYHSYHHNPRLACMRKFLARWMPQPRAIICPSDHMIRKVRISGRFERSALHRVYNATSLLDCPQITLQQRDARAALGIPLDRMVVLMVAQDLGSVLKGVHLGVQALNALPRDIPLHVLLLGRNTEGISTMLPNATMSTMFAKDDVMLAQAYRAADVTLIPSLAESLSYVGLESLTCGTPLVAFRVGGPGEIIGNNERGLAADPFDVNQLRDHLITLLRHADQRRALGEAGRAWVREHCGMSHYLDQTQAIYEQVVAAGPLPPRTLH